MAEETGTIEATEEVTDQEIVVEEAPSLLSDVVEATTTTVTEADVSWRDNLPDEIANHTALKDIKDIESLAKTTIHAQKMVGGDKLVKPDLDSPKEEWDKFYAALGRPENATDYTMPTENMPEGVEFGPCYDEFCSEAHRVGMTTEQVAAVVRWQAHANADAIKDYRQRIGQFSTESVDSLKQEFGDALNEKVALAKDAVGRFGGDELKAALNETGLGNHPAMVKAWAEVGKMIAQDEVIGGGGNQSFRFSPEEAEQEIADATMDMEFMAAYQDKNHPGHKAALAKMTKLYQSAHPTVD